MIFKKMVQESTFALGHITITTLHLHFLRIWYVEEEWQSIYPLRVFDQFHSFSNIAESEGGL